MGSPFWTWPPLAGLCLDWWSIPSKALETREHVILKGLSHPSWILNKTFSFFLEQNPERNPGKRANPEDLDPDPDSASQPPPKKQKKIEKEKVAGSAPNVIQAMNCTAILVREIDGLGLYKVLDSPHDHMKGTYLLLTIVSTLNFFYWWIYFCFISALEVYLFLSWNSCLKRLVSMLWQ